MAGLKGSKPKAQMGFEWPNRIFYGADDSQLALYPDKVSMERQAMPALSVEPDKTMTVSR
jgi:hypothetical protein